jgi:adenosylcobinamide kinase / adenosylcobinamide-phosphate guanylyltransferase
MPTSLLALGGARSGKSRHASAWILAQPGPHTYLATAREPLDDLEMRARIRRHRTERNRTGQPLWITVEEPIDPGYIIRGSALGPVLVDCATLWLTNLGFAHDWNEEPILAEVDRLCTVLREPPVPVAVVSNEVGQGIVPDSPLGRNFRDLQGFANQRLAQACHQVDLVVAGIPLTIKRNA